MIKKLLAIMLLFCLCKTIFAQNAHQLRMEADAKYEENRFDEAEDNYRKSLLKENAAKGKYNLGNAIYQQKRYDEAIKPYQDAAQNATTPKLKADAYHNLGNAYFLNDDLKNSIEAYKNALRNDPSDKDTKQNLALAQRKLIQQQQQQQQQNQDQDKEEQKEQQEQPQQQEQQQQEQDQQQQDEQNADQDQEQEEPQDLEQKDLTKDEARKLLEIMDNEEQKVQEKLRKGDRQKTKSKRDW